MIWLMWCFGMMMSRIVRIVVIGVSGVFGCGLIVRLLS